MLLMSSTVPNHDLPDNGTFPYDLDEIEKVLSLPPVLVEISGLSYDPKSGHLIAVNDEKAHFYFLDTNDGSIVEDIDFGKKGDYEGVEKVGDMVYAVKSNGNIYEYNLSNSTSSPTMKTALNPSNDIEGLGYDRKNNALILACKGNSQINKIEIRKTSKAFYSFSLDSKSLNIKPTFTLSDEDLLTCFEELTSHKDWSKNKRSKRMNRVAKFSPSAIAIHPFTSEAYILSSVGNTIVVADTDGTPKNVITLDKDIHRQPEGLCFDEKGNMYISNEGRGLVAKIYKYNYQK